MTSKKLYEYQIIDCQPLKKPKTCPLKQSNLQDLIQQWEDEDCEGCQ